MMIVNKGNSKTGNRNRGKHNKKSKRYTSRIFIVLCLIGFFYTISFAVDLVTEHIMTPTDKQEAMPLESDIDVNYDFDIATIENIDKSSDDIQIPTSHVNDSEDNTSWRLILVNRWNPIPDDYEVELIEFANGQLVDKRIYSDLQDMFNAARQDGIYPIVASGYRTTETQQRLLDEKVTEYIIKGYSEEKARVKAEQWVAVPGTSEHQLGIAVDINADGIRSAGHEVYDWLSKNAHKYGFICRYPADKTEITGVMGEAWHYRYVGKESAAEIYNLGICLEEYLDIFASS